MKKSTLRLSLIAASALSVSIASQLPAATFTSDADGDWDNPLSWVPDAGFPDTYVGDSAVILNSISYDGGVSTPASPFTTLPGGLSVANGNSITIDGVLATLTQATTINEIRIGEGTGTTGVGTLTIDNGGTFLSGSSLGVAVGGDIADTGAGDGTVNLNEGFFQMQIYDPGTGPVAAALGVGIEGSTGTFNVGDGIGGGSSAILELVTNNNEMGIGVTNQIGSSPGTGSVTVAADGIIFQGTGSIVVGGEGGTGELTILAGGILQGVGTPSPAQLFENENGVQVVGTVLGGDLIVGTDVGSSGTLTSDGTVTGVGRFIVGEDGAGTLLAPNTATINAGTFDAQETRIGHDGGVGVLDINGGIFTTGSDHRGNPDAGAAHEARPLLVGAGSAGSTGTVNILGGEMHQVGWMSVGKGTGNTGTINVSGAGKFFHEDTLGANNDGQIGETGGTGFLNITAGGTFRSNFWVNVARGGGAEGHVVVDGAGSTMTLSNNGVTRSDIHFNIGENGIGTLDVTNGAVVTHNDHNDYRTMIGRNAGSTGTVNVNTGSRFDTTELFVGGDAGGTGTLNIASGGIVTAQNWMSVGQGAGAVGTVNIDGAGSRLNTFSPILGRNGGFGGDVNIGQGGGTGVVNVVNGGSMEVGWWLILGRDAGSNGTVTVDGAGGASTLTVGGAATDTRLSIGTHSTGTMNIINGGSVNAGTSGEGTMVGQDSGTVGIMNVNTGGTFTSNHWLTIGNAGGSTGTVNLDDPGSSITLTGSRNPGNEQESARLFIGRFGNGTLNQTNGTITIGGWSAIALDPGATGLYNMSGGTITTPAERDFDFFVARTGGATGTWNVSGTAHVALLTDGANGDVGQRNGARVIVGADYDANGAAQGTLNIEPGTLFEVRELTAGLNGRGTVTQNGGTVTVGRWLKIGEGNAADDATNEATYTLNDGIINTPELMIGEGRRGVMNVHGGEINIQNGGLGVGRWGPLPNHGDGVLNHDGGVINSRNGGGNGNFFIGLQNGSKGVYNISDDAQINNINDLFVAREGGSIGSQGTVNMDMADSNYALVVNAWLYVGGGTNSVGTVNINSGEFRVSGQSRIGYNNGGGGTGIVNVAGAGAKFTGNDETFVGYESTTAVGAINVTDGGTVNINHWLNVGRNGGTGTVTQSSGVFTVRDEARFGVSFGAEAPATGTLDLSGGSFTVGNNTVFGQVAGSVGTLNLSGTGVLTSGGEVWVGNDGGTGLANITGGRLVANNRVVVARGVGGFAISNYATADAVIDGGPELAFSTSASYTTSNTQDNGDGGGPFGLGVQVQGLPAGDNNNFAFVALGNFTVDATGSYIFGNNTDDGSRLRLSINGGAFTEIITDNVLSGPHDVFSAPITLTLGDTIALDWMWFEAGGGAEGETFYSRDGGPNALWEDASQGLTLVGGQYTGTVYKAVSVASNGTVNLNGGVLATTFIEAGAGNATLSIGGGTLELLQTEPNFIRGFTNSGGHSGIILTGPGGTIDTAGFDGRIQQSNDFVDTDVLSDGLAGTVLTKTGLGTLTIESAVDTDGTVAVHVQEGTLDFEASQKLDALVIDAGATVTLSGLSSPPSPADGGDLVAAAGGVHAVPEPGILGLLTVGLFGLLGRRTRGKRD